MATKGPEFYVKQEIKRQLAALGTSCWYFMPEQGGYGRAGIPDFVGCYCGRFFAIEAKADKGRLSAYQQREIKGIRTASGEALVVVGLAQASNVVDALVSMLQAHAPE